MHDLTAYDRHVCSFFKDITTASMMGRRAQSLISVAIQYFNCNTVLANYAQIIYLCRYVDLIVTEGIRDTIRARSKIISTVRRTLEEQNFLEVETPVLEASAGGADAKPFITYHNSLEQSFALRIATWVFFHHEHKHSYHELENMCLFSHHEHKHYIMTVENRLRLSHLSLDLGQHNRINSVIYTWYTSIFWCKNIPQDLNRRF